MLTNQTIYDKITNVLADLVKWLTHWIVVPTYVGSIPTIRPRLKLKKLKYASFTMHNKKSNYQMFFNSQTKQYKNLFHFNMLIIILKVNSILRSNNRFLNFLFNIFSSYRCYISTIMSIYH